MNLNFQPISFLTIILNSKKKILPLLVLLSLITMLVLASSCGKSGGTNPNSNSGGPIQKSPLKYTTLAEFILDKTPHQLAADEEHIVMDFENIYMANSWVSEFWISYDDLCNDDGSPLTNTQKGLLIQYAINNSAQANAKFFRFANNNFEVLGQGNGNYKNILWKYTHNYLTRLSCLKDRLNKIGHGVCPNNKAQL